VASSGDERVADLASQLERTAMAWQRTALALAVTGALLLRFAATEHVLLWPAAGVVLLLAVGVWVAAARAYERHRGRRAGRLLLDRRVGLGALVVVIALSTVSCYAVLLTI
jgi:uncharacterized membrane protein YidH (DUF202 family)